ncbi:peptidyl-prolyl cis-trans isomerase FKBP2 isoform X1 [Herpailurus yagouaroundi]|uniref:peptidyl-prolyl cis-trans isomerase FKBP2 isoform X1 n=2 Tax=Herpailurus yagouaroundi TaxID=1608482 RepID=UPI001AD71379|nr:peptidyl-prolyl cis-trans isomerase FKBP2 isoform X1 [Puma yagouaroundi]
MARGVHAGAVSAGAGPGDAAGRELPRERWCGWSGLGGHQTRGRSGYPAGPRGLRAGAAPRAEAQARPGGCLRRIGAPRSHPAAMCGCLGAGPLQRPQRCGCAGRGATGCGVNGIAPSRQLLGSQIRDMRLSWVLTVLSICLSALATAAGAEGKRKLQIGVKKRVDHCPIKSRKGDVLHMHYTGKLEDGTQFDSSLPQNQPFVFSLGTGQVIKGWDQGLLGMCEGEKRKLVIPSELGYGERGAPPKIPGGATLVFEVELLKIERRSEL